MKNTENDWMNSLKSLSLTLEIYPKFIADNLELFPEVVKRNIGKIRRISGAERREGNLKIQSKNLPRKDLKKVF